jgi:signal transduction histidine kinase
MIENEIHRLERLVSDFLSFARPSPLELRTIDPAALLHDVIELVRPEAEARKVRLHQEIATGVPTISADFERLKQVVLNLVRNAFEATAETHEATVVLRLRHDATHTVEIDIEDNGPGFPEDAPIFDAFFTTKPQGTGLGLTIVHRIVSDHGGSVGLRSRPGETCFTVRLPRAP